MSRKLVTTVALALAASALMIAACRRPGNVDRVEIRWPSGIVQTLDNPAINTLHQVREPQPNR